VTPSVKTLAPAPLDVNEVPSFFSPLEQAEQAFEEGNYEQARILYEAARKDDRFNGQHDLILFKSALTYLLPLSSRPNWPAAIDLFKQIENLKSPFRTAADMILSLHADLEHSITDRRQTEVKLKQLNTELEALKQIDAADRRKRP